jgi:hypothetical protein
MTLRRPHYLVFEPRERPVDSLRRLLAADEAPGMGDAAVEWIALAPHLGHEVVVESDDLAVFQALAPGEEVATETLAARFGAARISRLVETGLLLDERAAHGGPRQRDARLRDARWWGPAALGQVFGRWDGVDVAPNARRVAAVRGNWWTRTARPRRKCWSSARQTRASPCPRRRARRSVRCCRRA